MPWKDDIWNSLSLFLVLTWVCTGYKMSSMVIHVALKMHSNFTAICSSQSSTVMWWEYHLWFLSQAFSWNKKEAIDNTWTNEHGHVSVTLYLMGIEIWISFNCHISRNYCFDCIFQPFKNVKNYSYLKRLYKKRPLSKFGLWTIDCQTLFYNTKDMLERCFKVTILSKV